MNEREPGQRLGDCRRRGEHIIGDRHSSERRCDRGRLLLALGAKEEVGDA
jgi:hypothetical protein